MSNIQNKEEAKNQQTVEPVKKESKQDVETIKNNGEDWVKSWGPMERMIQKQYE